MISRVKAFLLIKELRPLLRYFIRYIFLGKTRQKILFLGAVGLILSSFSLLVLQSVMGGLQHNLISRSHSVQGDAKLLIRDLDEAKIRELISILKSKNLEFYPEYEMELLVKSGPYMSAAIVHGMNPHGPFPKFLTADPSWASSGVLLGGDLAYKLRAEQGAQILFISPAHTDEMLGDIPRQVSDQLFETISTDVPEVDAFHVWVRDSLLFNLTREQLINSIRFYSPNDYKKLFQELGSLFGESVQGKVWEEENAPLVWSLNLESSVMLFLFISTALLIGLAISSGLALFFDKIKTDLMSLWILGADKKKLNRTCVLFCEVMNLSCVLTGLLLGFIFLYVLDHYSQNIMPSIFVDRRIPVHMSFKAVLVALFIPYILSSLFARIALWNFRKDQKFYLSLIRTFGQ